jgi:alpha-beta hydrolase superfamily lysophospholipase
MCIFNVVFCSDGDWVTLGWYEKDDLSAVIHYLRGTGVTYMVCLEQRAQIAVLLSSLLSYFPPPYGGSGSVSTVALWGRSMGAATALLHTHRDPSIAAMVLDSPFADLRQLCMELVEKGKAHTGYR